MGIFDSIKKAIFGEAKADTVAAPTPGPTPGAVVPPSTTSTSPASSPAGTVGGESTASVGPAPMSSATQSVDVAPRTAARFRPVYWTNKVCANGGPAASVAGSFASRNLLDAPASYSRQSGRSRIARKQAFTAKTSAVASRG